VFSPKAHLNSIDLCVVGQKTVQFKDGSKITYTPHQDKFQNTLFGTLNHLITGKVEFKDETHGITAYYEIGACGKKLPKDYFRGEIIQNGKTVSQMYGNYMGYIDFDGKRYWDAREMQNYEPVPVPHTERHSNSPTSLPVMLNSDSTQRPDSMALLAGDVELAQTNKNSMEEVQRRDRKLREEAQKRRDQGGPKISLATL